MVSVGPSSGGQLSNSGETIPHKPFQDSVVISSNSFTATSVPVFSSSSHVSCGGSERVASYTGHLHPAASVPLTVSAVVAQHTSPIALTIPTIHSNIAYSSASHSLSSTIQSPVASLSTIPSSSAVVLTNVILASQPTLNSDNTLAVQHSQLSSLTTHLPATQRTLVQSVSAYARDNNNIPTPSDKGDIKSRNKSYLQSHLSATHSTNLTQGPVSSSVVRRGNLSSTPPDGYQTSSTSGTVSVTRTASDSTTDSNIAVTVAAV